MTIQTLNPATGKSVKSFAPHTDAQIELAIEKSVIAYQALRLMSFAERSTCMTAAAVILEAQAEDFAAMITLEMGKPLKAAKAEVEKCVSVCRYYAKYAQALLRDEIVKTDASKAFRAYLPLGPVLAVMPWNFPFWQVIRFAAPALMAGNTGLLKHASNVPQCALALQDVFARAGFPDGSFQTLLIGSDKVEQILRDQRIVAATLTGSEPAGSAVAKVCGELIKPVVLELGGSDAFIVMPSADIDKAVEVGAYARTANNGQSCIAAKRFIIHADIYDVFKEKLVAAFTNLKVGDPTKADTDIGPLVSKSALEEITGQVDAAVNAGAVRVYGAKAVRGEGYFFTPGILENIPKDAAVYREEIFGPVALLFKADSLKDAIILANDSPFGLSGSVFTNDKAEQETAIRELQAGATFINSATASDPRLPFGGIKRSGLGRELSREGIQAFCNIKTVSIA